LRSKNGSVLAHLGPVWHKKQGIRAAFSLLEAVIDASIGQNRLAGNVRSPL